MSLPAVGAEARYRNPIAEVRRFLETRHPDAFNLCKERDYDPALLGGRVARVPVEDHNPPRLSQLVGFLEAAGRFMDDDPAHCIAVHCKGGKGHTGVFVCAWLLYSRFLPTATDAMRWFAVMRTDERRARAAQGVSQPSQQRYVRYVEVLLSSGG